MAKKLFLAAIMFIGCTGISLADLVTEGQIAREFSFTNLDAFKNYSFTYKYTSYHYDHGYQPNEPEIIVCKQNQRYTAGTRFDKTFLEAKDKSGHVFVSEIAVGGDSQVSNNSINSVVDVYSIVSIKDSVIKLKRTEEITVYKNGKEKKRKGELGAIATDGDSNIKPWLIGAALAAMLGLVVFFVMKRNKLTNGTAPKLATV
jgi:hypothetical protein